MPASGSEGLRPNRLCSPSSRSDAANRVRQSRRRRPPGWQSAEEDAGGGEKERLGPLNLTACGGPELCHASRNSPWSRWQRQGRCGSVHPPVYRSPIAITGLTVLQTARVEPGTTGRPSDGRVGPINTRHSRLARERFGTSRHTGISRESPPPPSDTRRSAIRPCLRPSTLVDIWMLV